MAMLECVPFQIIVISNQYMQLASSNYYVRNCILPSFRSFSHAPNQGCRLFVFLVVFLRWGSLAAFGIGVGQLD